MVILTKVAEVMIDQRMEKTDLYPTTIEGKHQDSREATRQLSNPILPIFHTPIIWSQLCVYHYPVVSRERFGARGIHIPY